jgi:2',3'-cyclic-nucleotide 2'-phosphodiesterase (5'-nucleotidase family)
MFALIQDGSVVKYPYTMTDLRFSNPNVSFSANISDAELEQFGVFRVFDSAQPEVGDSQKLVEGTPVFESDRWVQVWSVVDIPADETASAAASVREQRDALLSASDWTQLDDSTVDKAAWATYRQALRDIPSQAGFPYNVIWAVAP